MLVLSREVGQKVVIGHLVTVIVVDVRGDRVRLGFEGPREVPIHRQEVEEAIQRNNKEDTNAQENPEAGPTQAAP